jgi:hypothetical protein
MLEGLKYSVNAHIAVKTILTFGALLVASCASVGEQTESKLIGRWHSIDQRGHTAELSFLGNGTFSGSVSGDDGSLISQFTGRWLLRDGAILYQYTSDKTGRIRVGTKDRDKLLRIERDYFVIEAADGSVRKYVRASKG